MSDRELLTECLDVLTHDAAQRTFAGGVRMSQLAIKLRAHLAAPRPEPVFDGQSGHPVMLPRAPEPVLGLISDEVRAALKAADAVESQEAYRTRTPAAAPRPEPVAWMYVNSEGECEQIEYGTEAIDDDSITLLYAAPPTAAPEPTHPGYVIGSHWLETAYSRICAGEAEANVLRDYGLIREEAFTTGVEHLRQENERLRGLIRHILGDRITPEAYLIYGKAWVDEAHAALAAPRPEPESKTPAWWVDGLTVTLMREGVNKHRAREIAKGYWEAYCQIPGQEEVPR